MNRVNCFHLAEWGTWPTFIFIFITMAPYARWVLPSFKQTLLGACDEYMTTNDRGNDKTRSKLITRVAKDITDIVEGNEGERVPDDLEKVGNYFPLARTYLTMFIVCPHMVWQLRIRQCH